MTSNSVPVYQAEEFMRSHFPMCDSETLPVENASGRVLRSPLYLPEADPVPAAEGSEEPVPYHPPRVLIECGVRLSPQHIAAARMAGIREAHVSHTLDLSIRPCGPASIGRDATVFAVQDICTRHGFRFVEPSPETPTVEIRIGGGAEDRARDETWLVESLAAVPGKGFGFATSPTGTPIFSLPPVALTAMILTRRLIIPQLQTAMQCAPDHPVQLSMTRSLRLGRPETLFQPVRLQTDYHGERTAEPLKMKNLQDPELLAQSDGFVEMTEHMDYVSAGDLIPFYPW